MTLIVIAKSLQAFTVDGQDTTPKERSVQTVANEISNDKIRQINVQKDLMVFMVFVIIKSIVYSADITFHHTLILSLILPQ